MTKLSPDDIELLYTSGYRLYEHSIYPKAIDVFTGLILHDPFQARFWKGLAASSQMDHQYKKALHAWSIFAILSHQCPEAHFHAAQCLFSSGQVEDASSAIQLAEKNLGNHPDLKEKIRIFKEALNHAC